MTYVYVMKGNRACKVGYTGRLDVRLKEVAANPTLKGESPEYFFMLATGNAKAVERHAHYLLWESHVKGEWFNIDAESAAYAVLDAQRAIDAGEVTPKFRARGCVETVQMRMAAGDIERLDTLRKTETDLPSRSEMVRRLISRGASNAEMLPGNKD